MAEPRASVVITTHNEAARHCRHPRHACRPDRRAGLRDYPRRRPLDRRDNRHRRERGLSNLRLLRAAPDPASPLTTPPAGVDIGFRAARGEVILTLDGDSRVPPGWLSHLAGPILEGRPAPSRARSPSPPPTPPWRAGRSLMPPITGRSRRFSHPSAGAPCFSATSPSMRSSTPKPAGSTPSAGRSPKTSPSPRDQGRGHRITFLRGAGPVVVAPCPDTQALVARALRISQGPPSLLSGVLTIWPLTLLATALLAPLCGGFLWAFLRDTPSARASSASPSLAQAAPRRVSTGRSTSRAPSRSPRVFCRAS